MMLGHIDCNIVTHCNKACTACSHASPISEKYYMDPVVFERDLANAKRCMSCSNLQLVGGEPTLHPQIDEMLRIAKRSKVGGCVLVISNGTRLQFMSDGFWRELEALSISIYPGFDESLLELAQAKSREHKFALFHNRYSSFYTQLKQTPDSGQDAFDHCHWKNDCYTIHEGYFYRCPQSIFFPKFILKQEQQDGLSLDGITEDGLQQYLQRTKPMLGCTICSGGMRQSIAWKESKRADWIQESTER